MSARWDGLALHWDGKISPVRYDSSPPKARHIPGAAPPERGQPPLPCPCLRSQAGGAAPAGLLDGILWRPRGGGLRGKGGSGPRPGPAHGTSPALPPGGAAAPAHHRARPIPSHDRPLPGRTGPGPAQLRSAAAHPHPRPAHPRWDRARAGPFTATSGPSRLRPSPSPGRPDHPPPRPVPAAPPRGAEAEGLPGPRRAAGGGAGWARRGEARRGAGMAAMSSLEAVRRKIRSLQEQADAAEERAGRLQREVDQERALREEVGPGARGARVSGQGCGGRPRPSPPCRAGRVLPAGPPSRLGNPSAAGPGPGAERGETALGVLADSKTPSRNELGLGRGV